jgi:hypothetical protein
MSQICSDKSKDFEISGKRRLIDVFKCSQCGQHGETYREVTDYAHTYYCDYDPEEPIKWHCPKHPDAKTEEVDQYDKDIPFPSNWTKVSRI